MSGTNSPRNCGRSTAKLRFDLPHDWLDRLVQFLDRQERVDPVYRIAKKTGIPEKTIQNWFYRSNGMNAGHLLILFLEYDLALIEAALGDQCPPSLSVARAAQELAALEDQQKELDRAREARAAELASLMGADHA